MPLPEAQEITVLDFQILALLQTHSRLQMQLPSPLNYNRTGIRSRMLPLLKIFQASGSYRGHPM